MEAIPMLIVLIAIVLLPVVAHWSPRRQRLSSMRRRLTSALIGGAGVGGYFGMVAYFSDPTVPWYRYWFTIAFPAAVAVLVALVLEAARWVRARRSSTP
jgi:NO-binding membrane sensor protein with MHYT domain